MNYRELAGMSKSNKAKSSRAGSVKSVKTGKSEMSEITDLEAVINKEMEKGLGDSAATEPLPGNIEDEDVYNRVMDSYEKEERQLAEADEKIKRRQVLLDKREAILERRRKLEVCAWAQKTAT